MNKRNEMLDEPPGQAARWEEMTPQQPWPCWILS
jgi:hypothetical protein